MKRRNFVASLAALFAVRKLPAEKSKPTFVNQKIDGLYVSNKRLLQKNALHSIRYGSDIVQIEAGEEIDVGAFVRIGKDGKAYQCHIPKQHKDHTIGVCLDNHWPTNKHIMVALRNP